MLSRLAVGTRSMSSFTQPPLDLQHTTLLNQRIDETFAGRFELELHVPQTSNGWQLSARQKSDNASVVITGVPFDGLTAGRRLRLIHETARIRGATQPTHANVAGAGRTRRRALAGLGVDQRVTICSGATCGKVACHLSKRSRWQNTCSWGSISITVRGLDIAISVQRT